MAAPFLQLKISVKRIGIIMLLYSLCRLLFLLFNINYFSGTGTGAMLLSFVYGIRFDISAVTYTNAFFIFFSLLPFAFFANWYQRVLKIVFYLFNIPALLLNCIDLAFFRFTLKRTTADIFYLFKVDNDVKNVLPKLITDFWYILLVLIVLVFIAEYLYRRTMERNVVAKEGRNVLQFFAYTVILVVVAGLGVIGARGGMQLRPAGIINAAEIQNEKQASLVLNSAFTVIKTLFKNELKEVAYMPAEECERIFPLRHEYHKQPLLRNVNVVIIIMESFSSEYMAGMSGRKGYTPFLDSLAGQGLLFRNAFANGKRSIDAIPAILAGIPELMNNPYITSAYSGNRISGIAGLLREKGYSTSFYHGGIRGTMGFDAFTKAAGFEQYLGKEDYGDDKDFDGTWGIYDEEFFGFFADKLSTAPRPFLSCIFSLSSHHPYSIPGKYKNKFPEGSLPIHKSIRYSDFALREFFRKASSSSWFDSTLFVITADHTGPSDNPRYQTRTGMFSIPLVFYMHGSSLKGVSLEMAQHIDILPSVLEILGYDKPFYAFGNSIFDTSATHYAISFLNNSYQFVSGDYALEFEDTASSRLYHYISDTLLLNDLSRAEPAIKKELETRTKAFIQLYNNLMINNRLRGRE